MYLATLFKRDIAVAPWPQMILCALATVLPLIAGAMDGHLAVAIYGALTGYLLSLNDHLGRTRHRLWVIALTYLLLMTGFALGFELHNHRLEFQLVICGLVYWIGLLGGEGAELERAILFAVLTLIISYFKPMPGILVGPVFAYSVLGFACIVASIPLVVKFGRHPTRPHSGLRASFRRGWSRAIDKHIHALSYTLAAFVAIWWANELLIERGYWVVITVLLVMRADRIQSLYKTSQRLVGTALGVLICDLGMQLGSGTWPIIAIIGLCAFAIPWALKINYLLASLLITMFIVFLLELAAVHHGSLDTAFLRLKATLIGCLISVLGTVVSELLRATNRVLRPG